MDTGVDQNRLLILSTSVVALLQAQVREKVSVCQKIDSFSGIGNSNPVWGKKMEKGEDKKKLKIAVLPAYLFPQGTNTFLGLPTNKIGLADEKSVRYYCKKIGCWEKERSQRLRKIQGMLPMKLYHLHQETPPLRLKSDGKQLANGAN